MIRLLNVATLALCVPLRLPFYVRWKRSLTRKHVHVRLRPPNLRVRIAAEG
jgi:hypothetical protein